MQLYFLKAYAYLLKLLIECLYIFEFAPTVALENVVFLGAVTLGSLHELILLFLRHEYPVLIIRRKWSDSKEGSSLNEQDHISVLLHLLTSVPGRCR